jgi:hypothetical protein
MSSVLFQSVNSSGPVVLRNELSNLRQLNSDLRKDLSLLLKAVEAKSPEVMDEFNRLKSDDTGSSVQTTRNTTVQNSPGPVNNINMTRR